MKIWHESFYSTDWKKRDMLKWPQRMAISIGIARGVHFLHTGVAPGIFGNNIKIENVLLDDSLNARVSGYSIPLPSKVRTDTLHNLIIPLNNNICMITSKTLTCNDIYLLWSIFRVHLMNKVPPIILEGIFLCLIPFYSVLFHCCILIIICFFKIKSMCSTNNAEKEDIYQLGVILLEVITGRQIASSSEVEQLKDEVSITTFSS